MRAIQPTVMQPAIIPVAYIDNLVVPLPDLIEGKGKNQVVTPRFASMYKDSPDIIWITDTYPDTALRGNPAFFVLGWYFAGLQAFQDILSNDKPLARLVKGLSSRSIYESFNFTTGGAYMSSVGVISQDALDASLAAMLGTQAAMVSRLEALRNAGITANSLQTIMDANSDLDMLTLGGLSSPKILTSNTASIAPPIKTQTEETEEEETEEMDTGLEITDSSGVTSNHPTAPILSPKPQVPA
jgi:hypothetical protein